MQPATVPGQSSLFTAATVTVADSPRKPRQDSFEFVRPEPADEREHQVFTDAAWAVWEPLIEAVRPHGKTPPKELRRTISAVFWRHQNGAKWRSIPSDLGP